ncbi:MAG: acyl-CoA dehydrogenase, partial [Rhodomicrobium sp.]|nr:acyl-CoA dehydrogenase [Rhodomicrobium sp.]
EIARAHTAARAIGLARGALEDSIKYASERVQFNQPIASFQAIRFKIAEMATQIEAARQLMYFVCTEIDRGVRCDREASMLKLFASEMAETVTSEGIQIHGGAGYTTDFAVERYWRDARLTKIFEGTSEIQKRVISDRLLGDLQ